MIDIETQNLIDDLRAELKQVKDEWQLARDNLLWPALIGPGRLRYGGNVMQLDGDGIQIQNDSAVGTPGLYYVPVISTTPGTSTPYAVLTGYANVVAANEDVAAMSLTAYGETTIYGQVGVQTFNVANGVATAYLSATEGGVTGTFTLGTAGGESTAQLQNSILILSVTADPSTLTDGMIWYNSTSDLYKFRQNGVTYTIPTTSGSILTDPAWAAKGDLVAGTANDTAAILPVGANYYTLIADSAQTTGLKWRLPNTYNVMDYGATGDGSTDDTTAIQAAITAANSASGGTVFFPKGTYISTLLTMYSKVHLLGVGPTATTIKLKNSTNTALLQGSNFVNLIQNSGTANAAVTTTNTTLVDTRLAMTVDAFIGETVTCNGKTLVVTTNSATTFTGTAWSGGGNPGNGFAWSTSGNTTGGISDWSISQMTLDGNKANNGTTGYGIRVYGYRYVLRDLHIKDFFTNGIYSQWASASSENMEARLDNVRVHSTTSAADGSGSNVYWLGPHDSIFTGCLFFYGDGKGFEAAHVDKAAGLLFTNCHAYGNDQTYGFYIVGDGTSFVNCVAEGAATANVWFGSNNCRWLDGYIFAASAGTPVGIEVATGVSGYLITGNIINCTSNAVKLTGTDGGNGFIDITAYQTSGAILGGTPASNTDYRVRGDGGGTGAGFVFTDKHLGNFNVKGNVEVFDSSGNSTAYFQGSDGAIVWGGDVALYRSAANILQTDDQMIAGDGFRMKTKAGTPTDSDTTVDADGVIIVDTSASKIWVRIGGTWKGVAVT